MEDKVIRAYLWNEVINLGFSPSSDSEITSWLFQYFKSINDFLEICSYQTPPRREHSKIIAAINTPLFCFEYELESINKSNIQLLSPNNALIWTHDIDKKYFVFPNQFFLTKYNQRNSAKSDFDKIDMEHVIDGLIIHPAAHQHIISPIDQHEIRIGGGMDNPFLYLFNLRFQLCPFKEKRTDERNRLVELFFDAIKKDSYVTINSLMNI